MMTPVEKQYLFDFPQRTALGRDDFLISGSNRDAVLWIDQWPDWPAPALCVHGPAACGKTHLAAVWRQTSHASRLDQDDLRDWHDEWQIDHGNWVIEDVDQLVSDRQIAETLFHLYNHCRSHQGRLMLTARKAPVEWDFAIADLASRIRSCPAVAIGQPDDGLLAGVMLKLFNDRQMMVAPDVVDYLIPRIERSFDAVTRLVIALDTTSLATRKRISTTMARQVLEAIQSENQITMPLE